MIFKMFLNSLIHLHSRKNYDRIGKNISKYLIAFMAASEYADTGTLISIYAIL